VVDAVGGDVVDDDAPDLELAEAPPGIGEVVGEDAGLEAEGAVVDLADRVGEVAEGGGDDERGERLVGADVGRDRRVGQDRRREVVAVGAAAGLASWALLGGALLMLQQAAVKLPTTELGTLDGGSVQLSTMAGKPMVLNLWATWCPPCRREMPVLARAQVQRSDVNFVFVNQGESASEVRAYLGESQLQLDNVLLDPFSNVMREAGSRGLPTTLFFDAQGRLVDTHMGELTDAGLAVKLQRFEPASRAAPSR